MYSFDLDSADVGVKSVAAVRDEIDDVSSSEAPVEGVDYFLSDERIRRRLEVSSIEGRTAANVEKWAAASALDTLATNQAYVLKVGKTLGESRDGAKVAEAIRDHARALRAAVLADELKTETDARAAGVAARSVCTSVRAVW